MVKNRNGFFDPVRKHSFYVRRTSSKKYNSKFCFQITCIFNKYKTDADFMRKQGDDFCLFLTFYNWREAKFLLSLQYVGFTTK